MSCCIFCWFTRYICIRDKPCMHTRFLWIALNTVSRFFFFFLFISFFNRFHFFSSFILDSKDRGNEWRGVEIDNDNIDKCEWENERERKRNNESFISMNNIYLEKYNYISKTYRNLSNWIEMIDSVTLCTSMYEHIWIIFSIELKKKRFCAQYPCEIP